jgi:hypothetical protein
MLLNNIHYMGVLHFYLTIQRHKKDCFGIRIAH